jgi:hypothetical protein
MSYNWFCAHQLIERDPAGSTTAASDSGLAARRSCSSWWGLRCSGGSGGHPWLRILRLGQRNRFWYTLAGYLCLSLPWLSSLLIARQRWSSSVLGDASGGLVDGHVVGGVLLFSRGGRTAGDGVGVCRSA